MRCKWRYENGVRKCRRHRYFSDCFTRPGCDGQGLLNKPIFLLLPAADPGFAQAFADPTARINEILDGLAATAAPGQELAVIVIEDADGDDRLAISWVSTD
jgi:hypothetical protein